MSISISNISVKETDLPEFYKFVEENGFSVESSCSKLDTVPASIKITTLQSLFPDKKAKTEEALDYALKRASLRGIEKLVFGAPDRRYYLTREHLKGHLRQNLGSAILLENVAPVYGTEVLYNPKELVKFCDEAGFFNLGICFDIENHRLQGCPTIADIPVSFSNWVKHIHVSPAFHKLEYDWNFITYVLGSIYQPWMTVSLEDQSGNLDKIKEAALKLAQLVAEIKKGQDKNEEAASRS